MIWLTLKLGLNEEGRVRFPDWKEGDRLFTASEGREWILIGEKAVDCLQHQKDAGGYFDWREGGRSLLKKVVLYWFY